ncbi:MAG: putative accessory gene regulator protein [Pelotomaculum sp. PtaB.Bin104]|nr:MAG: putative accessory gene regulator protein [Pelotomaculum sp. PtaB.Bin104]
MSLYSISEKVAGYITTEANIKDSQVDSVRYGMEIILGALIKGLVLITTSFLLGIQVQVIIAFICGSLLRLTSGGAHCTSYLRCLGCGLVVYLSIGKSAIYLEKLQAIDHFPTVLFLCVIMILCACLWAPGDVPYRPMNQKESLFFKGLSILLIAGWTAIAYLVFNKVNFSFIMSSLLALLVQTFSFSPPGYFIIGKIDSMLLNFAVRKGGASINAEN